MPTLLFIRGTPGAGKITVARILQTQLGWKLFWLHDLDGVCKVLGNGRDGSVAKVMDEITEPVLRYLMSKGENLIYVRPARNRATIERVSDLAAIAGYRFEMVTLTADYRTLCRRVTKGDRTGNRINRVDELDEYLDNCPPVDDVPTGLVIETDGKSPAFVADYVKHYVEKSVYAASHPSEVEDY